MFYEKASPSYNLPVMMKSDMRFTDCRVGKYDFCFLKNTYEYRKAGAALGNCLDEHRPPCEGAVIAVKFKDVFIAAIEIYRDTVVQATLERNQPIEKNKRLFPIFKQWAADMGLKYE